MDQNPYAPPQSDLGARKPDKIALIVMVASIIALAIVGLGISEVLKQNSRNVAWVSIATIPSILSLAWARFPESATLRVLAVLSGMLFCLPFMAAFFMHLRRFGMSHAMEVLGSGFLVLAIGVNVVAMFAWEPPATSTSPPRASA